MGTTAVENSTEGEGHEGAGWRGWRRQKASGGGILGMAASRNKTEWSSIAHSQESKVVPNLPIL